jgi:hypothetical protein
LPIAWTPGISWADNAAIFATTDDEIDVVPCSLFNAAPPPPPERSKLRDDDRSPPRDDASSGLPAMVGVDVAEGLEVGVGLSDICRFLLGNRTARIEQNQER